MVPDQVTSRDVPESRVRDLTADEITVSQGTDPDRKCYVAPPKPTTTTTTVDTAKWACGATTVTTSTTVTTTTSVWNAETLKWDASTPTEVVTAGVRQLTAAEKIACPVVPASSTPVLASTGSNLNPWAVGGGGLALLLAGGLLRMAGLRRRT